MEEKKILQETARFIASEFAADPGGHDWFHVERVRKMALNLGKAEGSEPFITEMAALLHDLDDWKTADAESSFPVRAEKWMTDQKMPPALVQQILEVIEQVSFKGAGTDTAVSSLEAAVVQDADRLDAMGAIGIARTFAYGGHKKRLMYDPEIAPAMHPDFQAYKKSTAPTVNHFYEKLLLLKDRMNTNSARSIAVKRHQFMESYLEQFFGEWEGKK